MRKSRVLLAGVVVAAAAAATSAFTASNTVPASVAGYGEGAITGAIVTDIHYVQNAADSTNLDSVVFTTSTDVTGRTATMTLKKTGAVVGTPYGCVIAGTVGTQTITCDTTGSTRKFEDFDSVGLTVLQ